MKFFRKVDVDNLFFSRNVGCDVAETINLNSLEDLEDKFSHQAAITK